MLIYSYEEITIHIRRKNSNGGVALALAASALAACSSGDSEAVSSQSRPVATHTATTAPKPPKPEKLTEQQELKDYVASLERNTKISEAVQKLGKRIAKAGDGTKVGYFDFYNTSKDNWKSKVSSTANAGWGYLQHNPQYGGVKEQVIIAAYRDKSGKINPGKGITELEVQVPGTENYVSFAAPLDPVLKENQPKSYGWDVEIIDGKKLGKGSDNYRSFVGGEEFELDMPGAVSSVSEAKSLDSHAITLALCSLNELGIPQ